MQPIYLDHNATTTLAPEAAAAMEACYRSGLANPASSHAFGRKARQALEDAREEIARLLGAEAASSRPDQILFTSGGTEANNLALFGLAGGAPRHAICSAIEHPSVTGPVEQLARMGWRVERLGVSPEGVARLNQLPERIAKDTALVSLMLANHETGALQPVAEAAAICAARGVPLHTDAVQAGGKIPLDFRSLGASTMSVSAHKFHGPVGIGALLVRHGVRLEPRTFGGFQQAALRPGTEPVALVVGMCAALSAWRRAWRANLDRITALRDAFEGGLLAECPELVINAAGAQRLANTSNVAFVGVEREALQMALDLAGVACSTGSACASGSSEPSPTLLAMGCDKAIFSSSLRFSWCAASTDEELAEAVRRILRIYKELQTTSGQRKMAVACRLPGLDPI